MSRRGSKKNGKGKSQKTSDTVNQTTEEINNICSFVDEVEQNNKESSNAMEQDNEGEGGEEDKEEDKEEREEVEEENKEEREEGDQEKDQQDDDDDDD